MFLVLTSDASNWWLKMHSGASHTQAQFMIQSGMLLVLDVCAAALLIMLIISNHRVHNVVLDKQIGSWMFHHVWKKTRMLILTPPLWFLTISTWLDGLCSRVCYSCQGQSHQGPSNVYHGTQSRSAKKYDPDDWVTESLLDSCYICVIFSAIAYFHKHTRYFASCFYICLAYSLICNEPQKVKHFQQECFLS